MSSSHNPQPGTSRSFNMAPSGPTARAQKRKVAQSPSKDPKKQKVNIIAADLTDADNNENGRGLKDTLHGVIYQLKLLMLFSYRCSSVDYSFKMYTEMAAAEKFDDVVLEYFLNNVKSFIFLQAKHSLSENEKITCADLFALENRFALLKYFTSYLKIKKNDKFKSGHKHFIINTNLGFKFVGQNDKTNVYQLGDLFFQSFDIKSNPAIELLNVGGEYYQLTDCIETLQSWFEENNESKILAEKLAGCLVNKKPIDFNQAMFKTYYSALVEIIDIKNAKLADNTNLSSEAQDFRLMVIKIVEETHKIKEKDFLERMAVDKSLVFSKSFKTYKDLNNDPFFPNRKVSVEDVKGFMNDCLFAVNQPNENELGEIITEDIGQDLNLISSDLASNNYSKKILDWFKKKSSVSLTQFDIRLILENTDVEITTIESSGQTKLLVNELKAYGMSFKKEALSEELLNFVKLSEQAVEKRICILENLDTLLGSLKVNQALLESCKYNDGFIFIKLSSLLLEQEVVMKALKNKKMRLIIVVCETKDKDVTEINKLLSEHLKNKRLLLVGSEEHLLIKSFLSSNLSFVTKQENRFSDFTFVSQQTLLDKKVTFQGHKIALNQLIDDQQDNINNLMLKSGLLESKTENIGDKIQESIGYNIKYYIDRKFQKRNEESKKYSTQVLLDQLKEDKYKKFILITDIAGMGKSTVLTHLSLEIKKANPHFWVVRIDLNANTEAFIKHTKKLTSDNVVEFIVDKLLNLKDELEKELFKHLLEERKVVLMLDAFDEIRPSYEKKGLEFFESLKKINLRQLWITTRPYLKNEQKQELSLDELFSGDQVHSLAITRFSEGKQREFLQKFWSQSRDFDQQKLKTYAFDVIYGLKQIIGLNTEFTTIPLHLFMIAKVYEPDESQIKESKLKSRGIDLFSLYYAFFDKKVNIYLDKGATSENNDARTEQKETHIRGTNLRNAYQHSAIELLFPNQAVDLLKDIKRETVSSEELIRSGIVVTKDGSISFVHRTFAEFFAVQFIMQELTKAHPNKLLVSFFLKTILADFTNYGMIRKFLNSFIEQSYQKDSKIGRLKNMGDRIKKAYNEQVINEDKNTVLNIAAWEDNSYIIRFLSDNLNVANCNDFSKSLIKCFMGKETRYLFDGYDENTKKNRQVVDELFALIKNCNFSIVNDSLLKPNDEGYSLWVSATIYSKGLILKKIWDYCKNEKKWSDADLKTKLLLSKCDGEYSLLTALSKDYFDMLTFLWSCAQEIKAQEELLQCENKDGQTLMQAMILRSYDHHKIFEAATLFLEFSNFYKEFSTIKLNKKENIEADQKLTKKRLSRLKHELQPIRSEHLNFKSILCCVAYIGATEKVDEIWRIAKKILNQDKLKTLLMETDGNGNKTWLLYALKCDDSLEKAKKLGTDVGLGDKLRQELLQIQDRPDVVNLKEELVARRKEISQIESTNETLDSDSTD